jgi:hypothetical protein
VGGPVRRLARKVLESLWVVLAWVLFAAGLIGCGDAVTRSRASADASADHGVAPARPTFSSYEEIETGESLTFNGPETRTTVATIGASGMVVAIGCAAQAPATAFATFVGVATSPDIVAAFTSTQACSPTADGSDELSLSLDDSLLTRSTSCAGVGPLRDAATALVMAACASTVDDGPDATSN